MVYVFNPIEMSSYFTNSHGHNCKCLWYTEILSMLTMTTVSGQICLVRDAMCIDALFHRGDDGYCWVWCFHLLSITDFGRGCARNNGSNMVNG